MSLRARLLVGLALVAVVLVGAGVIVTRTTEAYLVEQVDERLDRGQGPIDLGDQNLAFTAPTGQVPALPPADDENSTTVNNDVPTPFYVAVLQEDGQLIPLVSPTVADDEQPDPSFESDELQAIASQGPATVTDQQGQRYRVNVAAAPSGDSWIVFAQSLDDVETAVQRLVLVEAVAVAAVLLVLGLVCWWVLHLGVRPLKKMAEVASDIADGDLSHRVPETKGGTEAADLGRALNGMLASIEHAFEERTRSEEQVRRFVADASHELRTPVATIRGYAELHRSGGLEGPGELDDAIRRTEQEAIRIGVLVDDLLGLARLDQGRPLERLPVDMAAIVRDAVNDASAQDAQRVITAELGDKPVTVVGDDHQLRQVLGNLVGNAIVHTPPGTPIEVRLSDKAGQVLVEVVDHGEGMDEEVASHAFERFYRADPARTRHRGGSGLGLSIVDAVVSAHGGRVDITETAGGGSTVTVTLCSKP
jgi:two-component system OmpR family sensor kinase